MDERGGPFLWIGCTAWGMTEWLTREEVDLYLDDRKSKGMNVVQLCLFWGKRVDKPLAFQTNPPNAYGHRAFEETDRQPNPLAPAVVEGGGPLAPNDYWDHVQYCLEAVRERGMYAAVLPVWGRRYVNATHDGHSMAVFDEASMQAYGEFLDRRFGHYSHIIWVMGGDVKATEGADFREHYRRMAKGLRLGSKLADSGEFSKGPTRPPALISYHPDGAPLANSSRWFHEDDWLDFNMIETYTHKDHIAAAIRADLALEPPKPTVLAEGDYEGGYEGGIGVSALMVRRQAYQSFFSGAAGFTYGGAFDEDGNGPLFGPSNNWQALLQWEGASQMLHLRSLLERNAWPEWTLAPERLREGRGDGALEKLVAEAKDRILVYFPDSSACVLDLPRVRNAEWHDPRSGSSRPAWIDRSGRCRPPADWQDAVLVVRIL